MKGLARLLVCASCFIGSILHAQWDAIEDVAVCTSPKSQVGANVISDNQGGVWVLWYQKIPHNFNVPDSNRHGLQHLDSNGYPTLPQNGIILNDSLETFRIVGLYATSDGSLTVCYMGRTSPSTTKAYIQRFRQDGSRVWGYDGKPITGIAGDTAFLRAVPTSILPLADGGAYISLIYTYGSPQKGYIQRMSADGAYLWGDTGKVIYEYNRADPLSGLLFKRDEGGAFFASAHTAYLYMYLNGIDSSGNLLYPVPGTMVNNPRAEMNNFAITSRRDDPDSSGLMHFKVHTTVATTSGFKDELRLYICNGEGDLVHSDTGIVLSDTTTAYINANTLLPQNDGSIIYTYQASTTDRTPWYARRVGPSGGDLWETPVQLAGADSMIIGAVITQDTTGIIATWDQGQDSRAVYAQMLSTDGLKQWTDTGIQVGSQHVNSRFYPSHARDTYGNCIVCWSDQRNMGTTQEDIYCAKVLTTGWLVTVTDRSVRENNIVNGASTTYPNPSKQSITFNLRSQTSDMVTVSIFDNLGRVVHKSKQLPCTQGENNFGIQIGDVPNGTYYYAIRGKEVDAKGQFIVLR